MRSCRVCASTSSTSRRLAERSASGAWAISSGGSSKSKSVFFTAGSVASNRPLSRKTPPHLSDRGFAAPAPHQPGGKCRQCQHEKAHFIGEIATHDVPHFRHLLRTLQRPRAVEIRLFAV